jgi:hypothetical protein
MKQQTAVEFLLNEFQKVHKDFGGLDLEWLKRFDQANEMFEKQIIDAVTFGQNNHTIRISVDLEIAEQYFKEKFVN